MSQTKVQLLDPLGDFTLTGQLIGVGATFSGNVSIAGTLTKQDVTNVDSVGLITARSGIKVTGGGINVSSGVVTATSFSGSGANLTGIDATALKDGGGSVKVQATTTGAVITGVATVGGAVNIADSIVHTGDTNTKLRFPSADTITAETSGTERVRVTGLGTVGIGTVDPELKLHIQDGVVPSRSLANSNCDVVIEGETSTGIQFFSGTQTQLRFGDAASTAAGSIIYDHSANNFRLNYSNSGYLSLYDGGGENVRFTPNNEIGIAGANYGDAGQVLTSGGSGAAISWSTVEAAPTITATATGSIGANAAVHLKSDGTVQVPVLGSSTFGSEAGIGVDSTSPHGIAYDPFTKTVLAAYGRGSNLRLKAGIRDGTSITWGAEIDPEGSHSIKGCDVAFDQASKRFVVVYSRDNGAGIYWVSPIVTGTVLTVPSGNKGLAFNASSMSNDLIRIIPTASGLMAGCFRESNGTFRHFGLDVPAEGSDIVEGNWDWGTIHSSVTSGGDRSAEVIWDASASRVVYIYHRSNGLRYRLYSQSGDALSSQGSEGNLDTGAQNSKFYSGCYHSGEERIVFFYNDNDGNSRYVCLAGDVSSTSISWGSKLNILASGHYAGEGTHKGTIYSPDNNKVFNFIDNDNAGDGWLNEVTLSGSTCTLGSQTNITTGSSATPFYPVLTYDTTEGSVIMLWRYIGGDTTYKVMTGRSTSLTNANFIGFSQAAYSNGNAATINVVGNTTTQSSLTPGLIYYVQKDGTLGTTAGNPNVAAGKAITTTKILIKG
tara:strand:- start:348 stop:2669 length:2322 start_codon:yes stop_codon:yes gene_type:complete